MLPTTYLPYPTYPVYALDADDATIGSATLIYVIAEGTTGSLTLRQLELADAAGKRAVWGHGQKPGRDLANIQAARDIITPALVRRREEAAAAEAEAAAAAVKEEQLKLSEVEQDYEAALQLTNEQMVFELFKELLARVNKPPSPDGGVKAKLQPPKRPLSPAGVVV